MAEPPIFDPKHPKRYGQQPKRSGLAKLGTVVGMIFGGFFGVARSDEKPPQKKRTKKPY